MQREIESRQRSAKNDEKTTDETVQTSQTQGTNEKAHLNTTGRYTPEQLKEILSDIQSSDDSPQPKLWIFNKSLGIYRWRSIIVMISAIMLAYIKWHFFRSIFPVLTDFEMKAFSVFMLVYVYVCFSPSYWIRHTLPPGVDRRDLADAIYCNHCITLHDEKLVHCDICDCCTWNKKHHCTLLGVCIDGHKLLPFTTLGIFCIFFIGVLYYEAAKLAEVISKVVYSKPSDHESLAAMSTMLGIDMKLLTKDN